MQGDPKPRSLARIFNRQRGIDVSDILRSSERSLATRVRKNVPIICDLVNFIRIMLQNNEGRTRRKRFLDTIMFLI
jgi:hypothetical protein